ncbi:MAG: hypothetical protein ACLUUO_13145 [Sellimonas intestinalis]
MKTYSAALFPQVATDFFKYREAQETKVDATIALKTEVIRYNNAELDESCYQTVFCEQNVTSGAIKFEVEFYGTLYL